MDNSKQLGNYYVPGIISLILLPIIFLSFAHKEIKRRTLTTLPLFIMDTSLLKKYLPISDLHRPFLPIRKYTDINFTGDIYDDRVKLAFARIRIEEILSQNDTVSGVHFMFGDSSHYGTFVSTINNLKLENAKVYLAIDNNIWFCYITPDTTHKPYIRTFICGTSAYQTVFEPEISLFAKSLKQIKNTWTNSWEIISSFIGLLFIFILKAFQKNGR